MEHNEIIQKYDNTDIKNVVCIEKNNGDIRMNEENFILAINHYSIALYWLKILIVQKEETIKEDDFKLLVYDISLHCNLNLAICHSFQGQWEEVVYFSSKVLEIDSTHRMALYYRIMALQNILEYEKAATDIKILDDIKPMEEIQENFQKLKTKQSEYQRSKQNEGEIYKKLIKTYFEIQAKKECEDNKKRLKTLMTKFPQAASSLIKLWINLFLFYPFKLSWKTTAYLTEKLLVDPLLKMYSASVEIANKSYKLTNKVMAKLL